jgi:hypothetical protein
MSARLSRAMLEAQNVGTLIGAQTEGGRHGGKDGVW